MIWAVFEIKDDARQWLIDSGFQPCHADDACAMGVWNNLHTRQYVRAFKNLKGGWTIQTYTLPDPDNYINE